MPSLTRASSNSAVAVKAAGLSHRYGDRIALDNLSLTVPAGSVFGLLGPNGSGKSTFLSILVAMEHPQAGTLRVLDAAPDSTGKQRMGIVFQENTADPLMTPNEILSLSGRLFGLSRKAVLAKGDALLEQFGLATRADDPVESLSGGMRRRLELARALLHEPELLLLDEPTTGVDPDERQALWAGLRAADSASRTVLLATNDLLEADAVCDEVALLRKGELVAAGTPAELKRGLRAESLVLSWEHPLEPLLGTIESWPDVGTVSTTDVELHITADEAAPLIPRLFELADGAINSISIRPSTLEDAYLHHVGRRNADRQ